MTRRWIFQAHWFLGITAGFVLAVMGITGAMMMFQGEIMRALSPGVITIAGTSPVPLAPDALMAAASRQRHGLAVRSITLEAEAGLAGAVTFAAGEGQQQGETSYIDPADGRLLGPPVGQSFFAKVEELHRWLALPGRGDGPGRLITGIAALSLIFFALSGLYLRWPRRPLDRHAWFVLDLRRTGRNLHRTLHAVVGGWVLSFYLLSALTGLWWSFDWYREGARYLLTGASAPAATTPSSDPEATPLRLGPAWATFHRIQHGPFTRVIIVPEAGDRVSLHVLGSDMPFGRKAMDDLRFEASTGKLVAADRYAGRRPGEKIASSVFLLHTGQLLGWPGRLGLFLASLTMPLFTVTGLLLYLDRRRSKRALASVPAGDVAGHGGPSDMLILHASQTGNAERLARLTATAFPGAVLKPLGAVTREELRAARRLLVIAATYGEGGPPDPARAFSAKVMSSPADLAGVDYAVLALGDRQYPDFCAFGRRLDGWLHASGARRLFDRVERDGDDTAAESQWQHRLRAIGGDIARPQWRQPPHAAMTLVERQWLNPGSPGAPVFRIVLAAPAQASWAPGAVAEVLPRHDPARIDRALMASGLPDDVSLRHLLTNRILPADGAVDVATLEALPHRDYSIASLAESGRIELIVRQCPASDGGLGIGSGWLTAIAEIGNPVDLRLRANPGFAPPVDPATPLVLIGNGTGLAGLLAHLRERARTGGGEAWLLYGERSPEHDRPFAEELDLMVARGSLDRIDRAFSRAPGHARYVQDLVTNSAPEIAQWADRGAAIYVCGSLAGMAPAVDDALRKALGDSRLEAMAERGLYRRDIY